jgi:hypothetical protein
MGDEQYKGSLNKVFSAIFPSISAIGKSFGLDLMLARIRAPLINSQKEH